MRSKQIFFFATKEDLYELLKFIETNFNIHYAEAGLLDERVSCISSLYTAVEFNHIEYGDWNFNEIYIIIPKDKKLKIREVPQRAGGIKYAVDQRENDESIEISLGGKYKDEAIIASKIATISQTEFAKNMMKQLSIYFKKIKKIEEFYVFPEALKIAAKGVRLTTDIRYPSSDLII